eukprot:TCONS_00062996-protein
MGTNSDNFTFCHQLPVIVGNSTFCGLKNKWTSRFSEPTLLAMTIIPTAIYWMVLLAFVKTLYKTLMEFRGKSLEEAHLYYKNVLCHCRCCNLYTDDDLLNAKLYISIVLIPLFKYFWDAIDLTFDVYIFYQLEKGNVLDNVIYRNENVNNSIYGFALLGCICKVFTWKFFQHLVKKRSRGFDEILFLQVKNMVLMASFIFEDGPEMILEYFYIEKYITSLSWLLLVKDVFIGIVAISTCFSTLIFIRKS